MLDVKTLVDTEHELDYEIQSQCLLAIGAALRSEEMAG